MKEAITIRVTYTRGCQHTELHDATLERPLDMPLHLVVRHALTLAMRRFPDPGWSESGGTHGTHGHSPTH